MASAVSVASAVSAATAIHRRVVPGRARDFKRLIRAADVELSQRRRRGASIAGKPASLHASNASHTDNPMLPIPRTNFIYNRPTAH